MNIELILEKLDTADALLAEWLTDNTVNAFEEEPEIDNARSLVNDVMDIIREEINPRGVDIHYPAR